jgi:alkanesulfonate monooxygenase SsuD/methylene tetrahydromethanopterin reductase-like flavin-dependent oxidoreductase (luciferase family)
MKRADGAGNPLLFVRLRASRTLMDLSNLVQRLDAQGVAGVMCSDHLFRRGESLPRSTAPDPWVLLTAFGSLSQRLMLGTLVANSSLQHPAFIARGFAELVRLFGSSRVVVGLGAGWNAEEYHAVGMIVPSLDIRLARLVEAVDLVLDMTSPPTSVRPTPESPPISQGSPPTLLLGGGSDAFLDIAGRCADMIDLNAPSRRIPPGPLLGRVSDKVRRLRTTIEDLRNSVAQVSESAEDAGRQRDDIRYSLAIDHVIVCNRNDQASAERQLCEEAGISPMPLGECPYLLVGDVQQMRDRVQELRDSLGVTVLTVNDGPDLDVIAQRVIAHT